MIITASRRTDIPAFFSPWFMRRIQEGHFVRVNPFNPKQAKAISLAPDDVDALLFVSKNPRPLLPHLDELDSRGYRYCFHFTLNDYPKAFEPGVPPIEERIETFQRLGERLGAAKVVWRYDPIVISSVTPPDYHVERFARLAEALQGSTCRVIVSYMDFYAKAQERLRQLSNSQNIRFDDFQGNEDRFLSLAKTLRGIVDKHGMSIQSCAEVLDLTKAGIPHGSCIDARWFNELFDRQLPVKKDPSQRGECLCSQAADMGHYNTCQFGCIYCYATFNHRTVESNLKRHHSDGAALVGDYDLPFSRPCQDDHEQGEQLSLQDLL